jgi:hypothetical protein
LLIRCFAGTPIDRRWWIEGIVRLKIFGVASRGWPGVPGKGEGEGVEERRTEGGPMMNNHRTIVSLMF